MNRSSHKYPFIDLASANKLYAGSINEVIRSVADSGIYIGGEKLEWFERTLAGFIGTEYAVGVASGLDALRLTLRALKLLGRLNDNDEVIVAANTYIASVLAITDAGLKPVLVDPDPGTMNLSAEGIEAALTPATKAIMPVHLYGRVCYSDEMGKLVNRNSLLVIEDCAQAIGAAYSDIRGDLKKKAGALGVAGCFSFYPTKNIGCMGDGGAVTTDDRELAETIRALGNYGSLRRYENIYCGFNSRLDPLQAAVLSVKLPYTDSENAKRREKAQTYIDRIERQDIILPAMPSKPEESVWHQFVIRVPSEKRDKFRSLLLAEGVETDIHYPTPLFRQSCYADFFAGQFPVTETLSREIVTLPIANHLDLDDISNIANIINRVSL
ncbi:MAG: DegT/DnrJ/EryC1/StrS family aminotransferase [Paramuribaculum sp.]|nr:DegT/DnrJ/EryC1/StrS family aminotransferase [Paramuribaculum sp.]